MILCLTVTHLLPAGYLRLVWHAHLNHDGKKKVIFSKCSLLQAYDKLPKTSQRDAATKLDVPQATLCSLLKQRETVTAVNITFLSLLLSTTCSQVHEVTIPGNVLSW